MSSRYNIVARSIEMYRDSCCKSELFFFFFGNVYFTYTDRQVRSSCSIMECAKHVEDAPFHKVSEIHILMVISTEYIFVPREARA